MLIRTLLTFFLHQGVSKPSKYTVLLDENGFNADQMQTLVYYLCFSCARTRNSISLPVALNYADLLAYRAKGWIKARAAMLTEAQKRPHGSANQEEIIATIGDKAVKPNHSVQRKQFYV